MGNRAATVSQADIARVIRAHAVKRACGSFGSWCAKTVCRSRPEMQTRVIHRTFWNLRTNPRWCSDGQHAPLSPALSKP
jgi:hypothetical protein